MVSPDQLTSFFGNNWWVFFQQLGVWVGYGLLGIIILVALFFFTQIFSYKIKVLYYPVQKDAKSENVSLGMPKKDRGRRIKINGIEHFRLLWARKTIKDIPFDKEYPDGVFLIRKSRDEFDPIARPVLGNPSVTINVVDSGLQLWAQLRGQAVRKRFTDVDLQKKQMYIFAGIIIGCLIFAGIVIWMSYATSAGARESTNGLIQALNGLGDKIGIAGPG